MNKHTLTLVGGPHNELRLSAAVLHETLGALLEGARLATRFAVDGGSVRKGPRPAWLDAACAVEVTRLSAGSAVLAVEAPKLREVDPSRFGDDRPRLLFEDAQHSLGEYSAVDLFGQALAASIERSADEIVADRALLESCARFAKVAGGSLREVRLDGLHERREPLVITPEHASRIETLRDKIPHPQAVRIAGTLDTISASRADVTLKLSSGARIPARMGDHDVETLKALLGVLVVVSGMARYSPSGRLLLLDVDSIREASPTDRLFETLPDVKRKPLTSLQTPQDQPSGVAAFFGTWPDEDDEHNLRLTA